MPHVVNHRYPYGKSTFVVYSRGTLWYLWQRIRAQDTDYCKNVYTGVRPLILMIVLIPEDKLAYQPLTCNYIRIHILE